MLTVLNQLLTIPTTDPEDARRRKLLNILLLGVLVVDLFAVVVTGIFILVGLTSAQLEVLMILAGGAVMLVGIMAIFWINRYRSGPLASALFLLLLTAVFAFGDVPAEVADGRSLFLFAIPIIMASVLLNPSNSFAFATLSTVIISTLAIVELNKVPNLPGIIGFYVVALVSWLSARSLEHALDDLRAINRELDQRVIERTQDLANALARVQAESSKNQAILASIADGMIVFDNAGNVIVANDAITDLLGHTQAALVGKNIETLLSDEVGQEDREQMVATINGERPPGQFPIRIEWGDKTLSVSFAPVRTEDGSVTGTVVVFRDYTREAEVDRMKSDFVSMVSHELRTPLNAILGYGDMLHEEVDGPLTADQRNTIQRIIANGRRMLGLVNNLLDQAQIEAGKLTLNPTEFDPNALVADLYSVMSVLAEQKRITLECSVADDVPRALFSDQHRLHQVLVNLVGNAIKFTDQGFVWVHVFRPDDAHWALQIKDTGAGIPRAAQAQIFEPFRQVDNSVTRHHSGSGLGLSIVRQLVTLLGGDITLTSDVGHGSTFNVTLPLVLEQEEVV